VKAAFYSFCCSFRNVEPHSTAVSSNTRELMTGDSHIADDPEAAARDSHAAAPAGLRAFIVRFASGVVTRGVVGTLILKAVSAVAGFAMFALAARSMTTDNFGDLVMWLSVTQIACVIGLSGQEMLVTRKLGEYTATRQFHYVKGVMLFSMAVATLLCCVSGLAVGVFALTVQNAGVVLSLALLCFMLTNAASMLGSQIARFFVGIFVADGSRQLLWRVLVAIVLVVAIALDRKIDPSEFFILASLALTIVALIQGITSWRSLPKDVVKAAPAWKIGDWTGISARFLSSSTLEATNQYFDVIVIYWLLNPKAAGGYYAASRLANLFAIVLDSLFTYASRHLPALYFAGRRSDLNRNLTLMAEVVGISVVGGLAVFVFGAKPLLNMFGPDFVDQQTTLIVLALGTAIQALGGPVAVLLLTTGHETAYTWTIAANVAMRLTGFCLLIPFFGVVGAAAAATISLAVTTVILNYLCRRRVGFDPSVLTLVPALRQPARSPVTASPSSDSRP
jgi:O-antigen/teichoic acid export membrane protein